MAGRTLRTLAPYRVPRKTHRDDTRHLYRKAAQTRYHDAADPLTAMRQILLSRRSTPRRYKRPLGRTLLPTCAVPSPYHRH